MKLKAALHQSQVVTSCGNHIDPVESNQTAAASRFPLPDDCKWTPVNLAQTV